jgi:hypothetical protein
MSDLGPFVDLTEEANFNRHFETILRRLGKLGEEYGEAWRAYLSLTTEGNPRNETWDGFREELIDTAIMAIDIAMTELPDDDGRDDLRRKMRETLDLKLAKWRKQQLEGKDIAQNGTTY